MTNNLNPYTAQQAGMTALAIAKGGLRLATMFAIFGPDRYKQGRGNTAYLTVPGVLTAHGRALGDTTNSIVMDALSEAQEPITLDVHAYSAVNLSEYDLTLGLDSFTSQVLGPQADAVAAKIESAIEEALAGVVEDATIVYDAAKPVSLFTKGRAALRAKGIDVAESNLVAIVGSKVADDLLESGALDFASTGTADALRDGHLGRIRGFDSIESGRIKSTEVIFTTRDGLYLAHRSPEVPEGVSFGATVSAGQGIGLRYIRDYDATKASDRSLVSVMVGAGIMPLYKVERTDDTPGKKQGDVGFVAGSATVTEVPGGAVVKVDTAA